ncbi:hypothetical protein IW261DRAFT_1476975 [Armillaria novae-zelandiae]|uniref:Uncharacterized protein n=1 Tax=Armillaria novae-zelandiae TaxID=153914 RepID=A0AA39UBC2_9AGAR|nr:hypothetical protein IW261DRAFT_1476975 [Armillaria novae-zelandiae]
MNLPSSSTLPFCHQRVTRGCSGVFTVGRLRCINLSRTGSKGINMQAIWRPLSSTFKGKKTVLYGLSTSRHAELSMPIHRQITTFASESLQNRYTSPVQNLRRVHVRTISYSSVPISIAKAFRVPIMVVLVGAGLYWYVCYKIEEMKSWALGRLQDLGSIVMSHVSEVKLPEIPETWLRDVQVTANKVLESATNGLKDAGSRIQGTKSKDVSKTGASKDLPGGKQHNEGDGISEGSQGERQSNNKSPTAEAVVLEDEKPPAWIKAVEGTANNILKSATHGLNDIGSRIQEVKLPAISKKDAGKFINNLLGGQQDKEGNGKSEGREGEQQSDKKAPTDAKSEIVDKNDRE